MLSAKVLIYFPLCLTFYQLTLGQEMDASQQDDDFDVVPPNRWYEDSRSINGCKQTSPFPDLSTCSCKKGNEQCDGTFVFDQQLNVSDVSSIKKPCDSLPQVWSEVIFELFRNGITSSLLLKDICHCFFSNENIFRTKIELKNYDSGTESLIRHELASHHMTNNGTVKQELRTLLQEVVAVTETCSDSFPCGVNARCSTLLNVARCRCRDGYRGDPLQRCKPFCKATRICGFTFPDTPLGHIATSEEICEQGFPQATAVCRKGRLYGSTRHQFKTFRKVECEITLESIIDQALTPTITGEAFEDYASNLQVFTTNSTRLSTRNVSNVVTLLRQISKRKTLLLTETTLRSLSYVASQLIEGHLTANFRRSSDIRPILAQTVPRMVLQSQFVTNQTEFSLDTGAFSLQTRLLNTLQNLSLDLEYSPLLQELFDNSSVVSLQPIRLQVPNSVVKRAMLQQDNLTSSSFGLRTAFLYYVNNGLFEQNASVFNVLSVNIGENTTLTNLTEPVRISHLNLDVKYGKVLKREESLMVNQTRIQCVYWNFTTNSWLSNGCCLNTTASQLTCQCDHLTNFALIVTSEEVPANFELSVVSLVGCILSILGLFVTISMMLLKRELRRYRASKILLHICCNLFVFYVIFIGGASVAVGNKIGCNVVTALLHYFLLAAWCWMAIYSYEMYNSLVKVFVQYQSSFMQRGMAICYSVPVVAVAVTAGVATSLFKEEPQQDLCGSQEDDLSSSLYHSDHVCWLTGFALYMGFLLPVGIIMTYNCIIFLLVTYELNKQKSISEQLQRTTKDSLLTATTLTFIIGLGWIFGYLLLISSNVTYYMIFSWLFAVFNTLQGFGIFVLTSIRQESTRKIWLDPIKNIFRRDLKNTPSSPMSTDQAYTDQKQSNRTQFLTTDRSL